MQLQTFTGNFPTERPPDPENRSPGAVARQPRLKSKRLICDEHLQDTATETPPSSLVPSR